MVRTWTRASVLVFATSCATLDTLGALVPPTVDEDSALPRLQLEVAGEVRSVHVQTFGDATNPTLLVLHGSLSDHRSMLMFAELADRYHVVLWDRRGMGLSERIPREEFTWDTVVEEIDGIADYFSPSEPVVLLGHSFGAMYSALYVSERPDRVSQAILIEPAGLNDAVMEATFMDLFEIDLLEAGINEMFWQAEFLAPRDHEEVDYKSVLLLEGQSTPGYFCDPDDPPYWPVWRPGGFIEIVRGQTMMNGREFNYDFGWGLASFEPEILLVGTSCSVIGTEFQARYHVPLFANVRLESIPDAGHRVTVEQPEALLGIVRSYLSAYP